MRDDAHYRDPTLRFVRIQRLRAPWRALLARLPQYAPRARRGGRGANVSMAHAPAKNTRAP